jgi:hypothetical protein
MNVIVFVVGKVGMQNMTKQFEIFLKLNCYINSSKKIYKYMYLYMYTIAKEGMLYDTKIEAMFTLLKLL